MCMGFLCCNNENILELDSGDDCTTLNILKTTTVHFKRRNLWHVITKFLKIYYEEKFSKN